MLLIERTGNTQRVAACSAEAVARGVRPGVTLAHAQALVPEADTAPFDAAGDAAALHALALWAMRFAPAVALDPPDALLLDVTGCARLFGGDLRLLNQAADAVERLAFTVRAALADTVGAAWALSHGGDEPRALVPPGQCYAALAHLPPWTLRLSPEILDRLDALGLQRIESLLMLPRATLPARFGDKLLLRIDQALGRATELLSPVRPPPQAAARMNFEHAVTDRRTLEYALAPVLVDFVAQLTRQGRGARRIELSLFRERNVPLSRSICLCAPNRAIGHLSGLLRAQLERMDPADGVVCLELAAIETGPIVAAQGDFFEDDRSVAAEAAAELFDRLTARCGSDRVFRPGLVESHRPEKAWRAEAISSPRSARSGAGDRASAALLSDPRISVPDLRPLRLLPRPVPIQAMAVVPDQPPMWFRYRGREHRTRRGIGPERLSGEWWTGEKESRDYYRVETENGAWFWVFREETSGQWYLHGIHE